MHALSNFEFDYMYKQKINVQITLQTISIVNMRMKKEKKIVRSVYRVYILLFTFFCMFQFCWAALLYTCTIRLDVTIK